MNFLKCGTIILNVKKNPLYGCFQTENHYRATKVIIEKSSGEVFLLVEQDTIGNVL